MGACFAGIVAFIIRFKEENKKLINSYFDVKVKVKIGSFVFFVYVSIGNI